MKKHSIYATTILLLVLVGFVSCKKDPLHIGQKKHYYQINAGPESGYEDSPSLELTLYPHGEAGYRPGGDIVYLSKYKIKGKKITVEIVPPHGPLTSHFTIISAKELHGENGQILMLKE